MKRTFITIFTIAFCNFCCLAQETAGSGTDKKIFVGLGGSFYVNEQPHIGARVEAEYFINDKLGINLSYNFGYSRYKFTQSYPNNNLYPTDGSYTEKTYNYLHLISLTPTYYFIGGASSDFSVFGGAGPAFSWVRSSEFSNSGTIGKWYGINLNIIAGADYALGPGKIFASAAYTPRLFAISTKESKTYFVHWLSFNLGYKIGF